MLYFTPGPSQLYPTVQDHFKRALEQDIASISHRSAAFQAIYQYTTDKLRAVLELPDDYHIFFLGSATEAFERIIKNLSVETTFHFIQGAFSKRFYEYSLAAGRQAKAFEAPAGQGHDVAHADIPSGTELICLTHNETSTGVTMPLNSAAAIRRKHPEALIALDVVSSLPYPALDYSHIDTAFFSVQKCFGMPAGLGVWLVSDRALAKAKALHAKGHVIGPHHHLPELEAKASKHQTPATPNVLYIYLLGKICEDFMSVGVETIRKDTDTKASLLYEFLEHSDIFDVSVKSPAHRSQTVIVANTKIPSTKINNKLTSHGFNIGSGYGPQKELQIRIANFPAHSVEDINRLITCL